jgi:hypothetical protein
MLRFRRRQLFAAFISFAAATFSLPPPFRFSFEAAAAAYAT